MLKVFDRYEDIDFRQLMNVYAQLNYTEGKVKYPKLFENLQILYAEQDFFDFLQSFLAIKNAKYFVWVQHGRYVAALRMEPYMDGYLLEAVETMPDVRRRGHATNLINAAISYMRDTSPGKIYSHVENDNEASLLVHHKCGFVILSEDAVYIDGTYHNNAYTLIYNNNPAD